jgi:hypothetical protein
VGAGRSGQISGGDKGGLLFCQRVLGDGLFLTEKMHSDRCLGS